MNSTEILQRDFLEMRSKIIDLAASLDRIDRAPGDVSNAQNLIKLRQAIDMLTDSAPDRARRVQMLFSRDYHENWLRDFQHQAQG